MVFAMPTKFHETATAEPEHLSRIKFILQL